MLDLSSIKRANDGVIAGAGDGIKAVIEVPLNRNVRILREALHEALLRYGRALDGGVSRRTEEEYIEDTIRWLDV